jgi:hypothetical protein
LKEHFNVILKLVPWRNEDLLAYIDALKSAGKVRAATFISRQVHEGNLPNFLSLPLWLGMLAFLAEDERMDVDSGPLLANDYNLIRECVDRVAEAEIVRHSATADVDLIRDLWERAAWALHRAYREKRPLRISELVNELELEQNNPLKEATFSFFDVRGEFVTGFFHEVFREYWLAEYIVDSLVDPQRVVDVHELLGYQRSLVTNKFIRFRIESRENLSSIAGLLREGFWAVQASGAALEFAKNQIVYLLSRIDHSPATRNFLTTLWTSKQSPFVRYAAAWAETMLGNAEIEREYYELLCSSKDYDEMNRGYHLYYYGDIDLDEDEMPPVDDGSNPAETTLRVLFQRIGRSKPRHLNLRRIELLTIRRFLETGRRIPPDVRNPGEILRSAELMVENHPFGKLYVESLLSETARIRQLL